MAFFLSFNVNVETLCYIEGSVVFSGVFIHQIIVNLAATVERVVEDIQNAYIVEPCVAVFDFCQ
eukprot:11348829-Ditylum_brightwellii.AAC.1